MAVVEDGYALRKKDDVKTARRLVEISAGTLIRDDDPILPLEYLAQGLLVKLLHLAEAEGWHWSTLVSGAEREKAEQEAAHEARDRDWEERCEEAGALFHKALHHRPPGGYPSTGGEA